MVNEKATATQTAIKKYSRPRNVPHLLGRNFKTRFKRPNMNLNSNMIFLDRKTQQSSQLFLSMISPKTNIFLELKTILKLK